MSVAYVIPDSKISHNRFDDEIIVVNLASGSYFSLHDTAAEIWNLLERGPATPESIAAAFADAPEGANRGIHVFLESLHSKGLLKTSVEEPVRVTSSEVFSTPVVDEFNELRELLLADIVHDTDEAGWPHLKK